MEIYCDADYAGRPASSLEVKLENDPEFKTVTCGAEEQLSGSFVYVDLGVYEIDDGHFTAMVAQGDSDYWAGFRSFALVPRTDKAEAEFARIQERRSSKLAEIVRMREQLKALGYLK